MYGPPDVDVGRLENVQTLLRLDPPLSWRGQPDHVLNDLFNRMSGDRELALDVLDLLVRFVATPEKRGELETILLMGGSEWEIADVGNNQKGLARRTIGPVAETIEATRTDAERAHHYLSSAWASLRGRNPNPSAAYASAIKAVEAVAKPIVSPDNDRATLGTIIRDIRSKPSKWEVTLDHSTPEQVATLADMIWRGQVDRHGSDDASRPLVVTQQEADAAVHLALPLVRLFGGGHFRAV